MRFRAAACICVVLAACSDAEPIGIHLKLAADGTGVVTCRSLQLVTAAGPIEADSQGVTWTERAQLFASRGTVADVQALRLNDVQVARPSASSLRLTFPRGPQARWHALLAPAAEGRGPRRPRSTRRGPRPRSARRSASRSRRRATSPRWGTRRWPAW
jgi:hypothetical protein